MAFLTPAPSAKPAKLTDRHTGSLFDNSTFKMWHFRTFLTPIFSAQYVPQLQMHTPATPAAALQPNLPSLLTSTLEANLVIKNILGHFFTPVYLHDMYTSPYAHPSLFQFCPSANPAKLAESHTGCLFGNKTF